MDTIGMIDSIRGWNLFPGGSARKEKDLQRQIREYDAIAHVGRVIASEPDIYEVFDRFQAAVGKLIPFAQIAISYVDHEAGEVLWVIDAGQVDFSFATAQPAGAAASIFRDVCAEERVIYRRFPSSTRIQADGKFAQPSSANTPGAVIVVPLAEAGSCGALLWLMAADRASFSKHHIGMAARIGAQISGAVSNSLLRRELQESEARSRAVLDTAAVCTLTIDSNGVIQTVNEAALEAFGYSPGELPGKNVTILMSESYGLVHQDHLDRFLETGEAHIIGAMRELEAVKKDGSVFPIELEVTVVRVGRGVIFTGMIRDISAQKADEAKIRELTRSLERKVKERTEELTAANRDLQELVRNRSEFLSTVSHELKTPLTCIAAFADILNRNGADNLTARQKKHLAVVRRNASRLRVLTNDLLDVSRVHSGTFRIEPKVFDVVALMKELVENFRPTVSERGQRLNLSLPTGPIWINVDPIRISQAVLNLLSNACKYSGRGEQIAVTVNMADDTLELTISDTGMGISNPDQLRLFTSYFRADNAETRAVSGTGLGLVIVKSIIEMHGGTIQLDSEPGQGTTVSIRLPHCLSEAPSQEECARESVDPLPFQPMTGDFVRVDDESAA